MSKKKAIDKVVRAWLIPGPRPGIHVDAKRKLREEWPALADALDGLIKEIG